MKKTSKRTAASRKRSRARPASRRRAAPRSAHERALVAFAELAKREGLRWYVFGAHAVSLHGFPRATADLDLTIDPAESSIAELLPALRRAGFDPRFDDEAFLAAARVIPVVHRASGLPVDLVLAGPGLEQRFLDEVELRRIGRQTIPILSAENLIVTKILAGRAKDLEDVREVVALRGEALDHARVEALLELLEDALDQHDLVPRYRALRR